MADADKKPAAAERVEIAVIGAGIAGLYCGYLLDKLAAAKQRADYLIAEASNHVGGRIWSARITDRGDCADDGARISEHGEAAKDVSSPGGRTDHVTIRYGANPEREKNPRVEFVAEYGPMRIELDLQHCLQHLLVELNFERSLEPFPAYQSPTSRHDPKYELTPDEDRQRTPLELLELAIVRVMGRLVCATSATAIERASFDELLEKFAKRLALAMATQQPRWHDAFVAWSGTLDEEHYDLIRRCGTLEIGAQAVPLWDLGFWNMLAEVLTHHAVLKLRDLGTFYHLIPENPNAAEWLIFWLRALRTSSDLKGIRGGMQRITESLQDKIDPQNLPARIRTGHKLVSISPTEDGLALLKFEVRNLDGSFASTTWLAKHVVLAIPTAPLQELARVNRESFYQEFFRDISAVFGFTLLKAFFVVRERWWSRNTIMTNRFATRIPTRELHFWTSRIQGSSKGMVMVSTDRPAASFWSNLLGPGPDSLPAPSRNATPDRTNVRFWSGVQQQPDGGSPDLNPRLTQQAVRYLSENEVVRSHNDFDYVGIRDWGRPPYGGAAHSWFPERRVDEHLRRLSGFALGNYSHDESRPPSALSAQVYVCGEAYSDYQAFIEGALRSVEHVLHRLRPDVFRDTPTRWACPENCIATHDETNPRWKPKKSSDGSKQRA